jgi:hypothetical protein
MKQKITISVEKSLLRKARLVADRESAYEQAKRRALARLAAPFHLGGEKRVSRESLHDRENLR